MKNRAIYLYVLVLTTSLFVYGKSACIIVHGTWASKESWYQPGGDFFESVLSSSEKYDIDEVVSFTWSGKNNQRDRQSAGIALSQTIQEYDYVTIIAHSHGATVGILASQDLQKNWIACGNKTGYKNKKFYSLGVPVNQYDCFPNMNVIGRFYNLFSFEDVVQPVFGIFGRTFFLHDRVANLSVVIDGIEPGHSGTHNQVVGRDILSIDEGFAKKGREKMDPFSFQNPGKVLFFKDQLPEYQRDYRREELIARDKKLMRLLLDAIMRKRKIEKD